MYSILGMRKSYELFSRELLDLSYITVVDNNYILSETFLSFGESFDDSHNEKYNFDYILFK